MDRDYKTSVVTARKEVVEAYKRWRLEARKQRLIRKHAELGERLKNMGVLIKQIPVIFYDGKAQKIKVSHTTPIAVPTRKKGKTSGKQSKS